MIEPSELMRMAIEKCREGIAAGQTPFGCAIASGDDVLAIEHNVVLESVDITAHAEITALRKACQRTRRIHFEASTLATTCEPCPMCMAAIHWARVGTVYFGASIDDARQAGFNELPLPAHQVIVMGRSPIKLIPNLLADECRKLFAEWHSRDDKRVY